MSRQRFPSSEPRNPRSRHLYGPSAPFGFRAYLAAPAGSASAVGLIVAPASFNLVPCENDFEKRFARFLEDAGDVVAFAKLPEQFGFAIEYTDSAGNLRYYEPDFVVTVAGGSHYLVETKGREDVDVAHKDRAAIIWCENASLLTEAEWAYLKVPQREFEKLEPTEFADLLVFALRPLV